MQETKKTKGWGVIILLLILFWPVGLFLLIRKLSADKAAKFDSPTSLFVASAVLGVFGIAGIGMIIEGSESENFATAVLVAILFIAGSVTTFIMARKMKCDGARFRKYINIVVNQNNTSLYEISNAVGLPVQTVKTDLQRMISLGYFTNAYIHEGTGEFVISHPEQQNRQMIAKTCSRCGANNMVAAGMPGVCEYCKSPL